jgi:hypothetical protein
MRRISKKRAARVAEAAPVRDGLKARVGRCEVCLKSRDPEMLAGHEIFRGSYGRQVCLDKPFGLLLVCIEPNWRTKIDCHDYIQNWSEPRQLALLYTVRPSDFDLQAYNEMVNPRAPKRIELHEVMREVDSLFELLKPVRG